MLIKMKSIFGLGVLAHICNSSTWEAGGSQVQGQPGLFNNIFSQKKKKKKKKRDKKLPLGNNLLPWCKIP
jgi:hypothetical protein